MAVIVTEWKYLLKAVSYPDFTYFKDQETAEKPRYETSNNPYAKCFGLAILDNIIVSVLLNLVSS